MNLNRGQILSIIVLVLGVLMASTAQLTDLFGPATTKYIVSASSLLVSILSGINTLLSGQGGQLQAVRSMPGVEKILVNSQANATLATMAMAPLEGKIEPTPAAQAAVAATAKAAE